MSCRLLFLRALLTGLINRLLKKAHLQVACLAASSAEFFNNLLEPLRNPFLFFVRTGRYTFFGRPCL